MSDLGLFVWFHCLIHTFSSMDHRHRTIIFDNGHHHFCSCGYRV